MTDERTTPEAYLGTWRIREIGERTRGHVTKPAVTAIKHSQWGPGWPG